MIKMIIRLLSDYQGILVSSRFPKRVLYRSTGNLDVPMREL